MLGAEHGGAVVRVYRVWADDVANCAWLEAESEADAIDTVSPLEILKGPLTAALDDKKFDVPKGVVLGSDGRTFDIVLS
jgi:hypothetical protein